ncbi:cold-shock protein [Shewanella sp. A14]
MKGLVVSYLSSKKYGFINGDDGESYFLHFSSLLDKSSENKLVKGVIVEFDPTPTPKGLAAKSVSIQEVYLEKKKVNFFMTKQKTPKHLTVEASHLISTRFFKDPNVGREHIKQLAIEAGGNAVLGLDFEKKTFSSGNYKYTMHAFTGHLALVTENVPCSSQQIELESHREFVSLCENMHRQFEAIQERESQAREKQLSSNYTGCLIVLVMLCVFVIAVLAN